MKQSTKAFTHNMGNGCKVKFNGQLVILDNGANAKAVLDTVSCSITIVEQVEAIQYDCLGNVTNSPFKAVFSIAKPEKPIKETTPKVASETVDYSEIE